MCDNIKYLPLTHPQKEFWYIEKLHPHTSIGNIAGSVIIKGTVDYVLLEKAVNLLLEKNDSMHLRIAESDNEPLQYVSEYSYKRLDFFDFSGRDIKELYKWDEQQTRIPVSLVDSDLFYFALLKVNENEGGFYFRIHHLISDAWTANLLANQIIECYWRLLNNLETDNAMKPSYTELLQREEEYRNSKKLIRDKEFWESRFEAVPELTNLKTSDISVKSTESKRKTFPISIELAGQIRKYCEENRISPYIFFLAVFLIYLNRVMSKKDIIIGTPVLNRANFREKNTIGMYISTIPLRIRIDEETDFTALIQQVAREWMQALRHYEYPYDQLLKYVREKHKSANINDTNLYDIVLSYQNAKLLVSEYTSSYKARWHFNGHQAYSLSLHINERDGDGHFIFDYDFQKDMFSSDEIVNMQKLLQVLMQDAMMNPQKRIDQLEILGVEEKRKILSSFNGTHLAYPREKTIHRIFEEQAARTPDSTAVVFEDKQLTYRELNEKSNQLAGLLREKGVKPDSITALMVNRSLEMIVGIIAILKAGGAFLPIDPEYPEERIRLMLDDSGAKLLLTQQSLRHKAEFSGEIIDLEADDIYSGPAANPVHVNKSGDLAYVIYTSGSTGVPKGSMLEHRSLVNFTEAVSSFMDFSPGISVLSVITMSFDVFIFEILPSLMKGLKVVVANEEQRLIPRLLSRLIEEHRIEKMHGTPSRVQLLADDAEHASCLRYLKEIIIGGEEFPVQLLQKLRTATDARIFNGYGPTEATIGVTFKELTDTGAITIGRPIPNTQVYILDKYLKPVPIGVPGEIFIGGEGVGRGYLKRPELTGEKFIPNPFADGERMYRTGDLASWRADGEINFLGRIDQQVKIRGLRIELGEIENKILKYKGIKKAVVIDRKDSQGRSILCAYYVPDARISVADLRVFLTKQLPGYMVPSYITGISDIPLTLNGKIDRDELPEPDTKVYASSEYVEPSSQMEKRLAAIWREVLTLDKVGIDDNFFELGGDSLSLISVALKVHKEFSADISLTDIYKSPTIRDLSAGILFARKSEFMPILPVEEQDHYPVSSSQKRLFILMQQEDLGIAYNTPGFVLLDGDLNRELLGRAFEELVKRHDAFRTSFRMIGNEPVQIVSRAVPFKMLYRETASGTVDSIAEAFVKPFDISKAPLLRVELVRLSENKHLLMLDMHHIISDGTSISILLKELDALYTGKPLADMKVRYRDFTAWQNELLKSDHMRKQEDYWLSRFDGEIPVLNLPTDYPRPSVKSYEGGVLSCSLGNSLTRQVLKLASDTNTTLYMVLLAAYNVLLSKYSGQEDIVVGTPVAGRRHADLENVLGMFVNTLAIRNFPKGKSTFSDFLGDVRKNSLEAYENQDFPFEELVDKLKIRRDLSRNPIFDVMFVLQSVDVKNLKIGELKVTHHKYRNVMAKFDLLLEAFESEEDITFNLEYCSGLFAKPTGERMLEHLRHILEAAVQDPHRSLCSIGMLSADEKNHLLYGLNDTAADYLSDHTIHQLFEEQTDKDPGACAVVCEGRKLSYGELNARSNQLARVLRRKGVKPDTVVGIMMTRSLDMIIAVFGILKAGGAYLPVDPDYPRDRVAYMLENSKAALLLTNDRLRDGMEFAGEIININEAESSREDASNPELVNRPEDLLYVIYTSGSTGKPKGVMIEHRNMVNLICFQNARTNLDFKCRVLQFTTISFDVCYQEVFSTLLSGGELHIAGNEIKNNVLQLLDFLAENRINIMFLPPAYLKLIATDKALLMKMPQTIRHIIVAGEQLIITDQLAEYLKQNNVYLHNHYGPSETHVVTTYTVDPEKEIPALPPIGRPISNTKIYMLDSCGNLQPEGVIGELYISGDNVGRGYLNRPELTGERFLPDPFDPAERVYKTGDLARWRSDGNIEFLGRIDHQIKIRGFRVELGEIESQLLNHPSVTEAVVVVKEDSSNNKHLCAYIVSEDQLNISELKGFLGNKLPYYMIPSFFIKLEKLPMTPSGKIDRRSLPEPDVNIAEDMRYEEPGTELEKKLAHIWSEVLNTDSVGINDNFFELGGDSLSIIQAQIKSFPYGWGLTAQHFYRYQTIRELACAIEGSAEKDVREDAEKIAEEVLAGISQEAATSEPYLERPDFRNVFLTGATGFLGIHVLNEIIRSTDVDVYCLIRSHSPEDAGERLSKLLDFYFPGEYKDMIGSRIFIVKGDITLPGFGLSHEDYTKLGGIVDTIIHTAAIVKHYGLYSEFEKVNVAGTQEVVDFALAFGITLNHISTTGISGSYSVLEHGNGAKPVLTEKDYYIGQNYSENVYIKSKFEAEGIVHKAAKSGLKSAVFRVGNLTGRYSDGQFQSNVHENAFYNRIKSIVMLGAVSGNMLGSDVEFSPVDHCSKAILKLARNRPSGVRALHIYNHNKVKLKFLTDTLERLGIDIKVMDRAEFSEYINSVSTDKSRQESLFGIIHDFNTARELDYEPRAGIDSEITRKCLKMLDFEWPQIDGEYLVRLLEYMRKVGFLQ